jgi:molecular chaperone Hsp33
MAPRATIAVINNTHTTETARRKHGLSETTTKLLGRAMAAAALMASFHKGEERVILQWNGIGGLKVRVSLKHAQ